MDSLEAAGIPGRTYLREALTKCDDPLETIESFQQENGILLPSLQPMLPLLDLHGLRRLDFHTSVLEELKEKLIQKIDQLGKTDGLSDKEKKEKEKRLKDLLGKSFPVLKVPHMQPVIMAILKNLDHVDDKYLKQIVTDKALYERCDVIVKRQIWQEHQGLFGDEVSPLLSQYIKDKENVLLNHTETAPIFFTVTPRQRRQNSIIQKLVEMVGRNVLLYDTILQFLRTLFLRTKNVHYCTLRIELLMALHDAEVQDITAMDPCHKFAWCLDACIREQNIGQKRSRELQGVLDGVKKGQEQVLGDLSMALCDPYAINFLASTALKICNHLITSEALPRDNNVLHLVLRMLNLGLHSWEILNSQVYREPVLKPAIVTEFIPTLMALIVDDQVRRVNAKLPPDDRETALTVIEHSGPPPDCYQNFIAKDRLAAVLAVYYTFQVCKQKDKESVIRVLGTLASSNENRALENPFLHNLVSYFIPMAEEFGTEEFCTVVLDELFLTTIQHSNVAHHLMRLLYHVSDYLPRDRIEILSKTLASLQLTSESSKSLHKLVETKLQERQSDTGDEPMVSEEEQLPISVSKPSH